MSKFLKLLNENTPSHSDMLVELKNAGVDIEETSTGFVIKISVETGSEEESEDPVSGAVEGMAKSPVRSTTQSTASSLMREREPLKQKILAAYKQTTDQLKKVLSNNK